jgi:hypothetical protein
MTDKNIAKELGVKFDELRRTKRIKDTDVALTGGTNTKALNKFKSGSGDITLSSFIKMLRGIGELDRLNLLFSDVGQYSPVDSKNITPNRVRTKHNSLDDFTRGDDE